MISQSQLQEMRSVDITQVDRSTLVDIRNIHIDAALPAVQKVQNYLEQIGNPYCFLCGDTPVQLVFADHQPELSTLLTHYLASLK